MKMTVFHHYVWEVGRFYFDGALIACNHSFTIGNVDRNTGCQVGKFAVCLYFFEPELCIIALINEINVVSAMKHNISCYCCSKFGRFHGILIPVQTIYSRAELRDRAPFPRQSDHSWSICFTSKYLLFVRNLPPHMTNHIVYYNNGDILLLLYGFRALLCCTACVIEDYIRTGSFSCSSRNIPGLARLTWGASPEYSGRSLGRVNNIMHALVFHVSTFYANCVFSK